MGPAALFVLLSAALLAQPASGLRGADTPAVSAVSQEPFYADIVARAGRLKSQTEGFARAATPALRGKAAFKAYAQAIRDLSASDLKGHNDLKARGSDNDLKCIMKGLSLDLNIKMDAIVAARSDKDLKTALGNMADLLGDNIDVIVTPETADSGLDCVIEFGPGA